MIGKIMGLNGDTFFTLAEFHQFEQLPFRHTVILADSAGTFTPPSRKSLETRRPMFDYVDMLLRGMPFGIQESPCPYLEGRTFYSETLFVSDIDEGGLDTLLSLGFRHFGSAYFRPVCDRCGRCIPIRIPVEQFRFSRNKRRVLRRVEELDVALKKAEADREKHELYLRHGGRFELSAKDDYETFVESFFQQVPFGMVLEVRREGRLISASHFDVTEKSLSAIYTYWDPDEAQLGLGTYGVLKGIEVAGSRGIEHVYLGYYVAENRHMSYKAGFRPSEALIQEGNWLPFYGAGGSLLSPEIERYGFLPVLRIDGGAVGEAL
jgi:leucyl-tRNA---protein transferase